MSEIIIGVDPGVSGGFAVVEGGNLLLASKFPLSERVTKARGLRTGKRVEKSYDLRTLRDIWRKFSNPIVYLEWVSSMPRDGSTQAFKFGDCFGQIKGLCAGLDFPVELVRPRVWQKYHCFDELPKDMSTKQKSQVLCGVIASAYKNNRGNVPDGISDAILIAFYGSRMEVL